MHQPRVGPQRLSGQAELALLALYAALGAWLVAPSGWLAALTAVIAGVTAVIAPRARRRGLTVLAMVGVAGAVVALSTSRRVRAVEQRWPGVREDLIRRAGRRAGVTLEASVALARRLADRGAELAASPQADAFAALARETRRADVESGVIVLGADGVPWSWAGRNRVPVERAATGELYARITSFYVVLEARRQLPGGRVAVGQVLLAADSAVPDRERSVASAFARATGSRIEFLPPGRGPAASDYSDYCLPSCEPSGGVTPPDTLFSVRTSPPAQGAFKLDLLAAGGRAVASIVAAGLVGLLLIAGPWTRYASFTLSAALLVLTPAGGRAAGGLGRLFSPVSYYLDALDPFTGSVGALLVSGSVLVVALVSVWLARAKTVVHAVALAIGVLAPVGASLLAGGITPPAGGARLSLWLAWELAVGLGATALALLAAWGARPFAAALPARQWYGSLATIVAVLAAVAGLELWQPGTGWPPWYPALWVPAMFLAAAAGSPLRQVISGTVVAGSAAALFAWGAVVDGRLSLARADVRRLGDVHDPVMLAMLDRFGAELAAQESPRTPEELYRRWFRTPLDRDGYPAILASWLPDGRFVRLPIADLDVSVGLLQGEARAAAARGVPVVEEFARVPGIHAVLAAPTNDGAVVTVGVGPRSRLLPRFRVAEFLGRQGGVAPPYELSLSEPLPSDTGAQALQWRRAGRLVRGDVHLDTPGGARHVHATVDLGGRSALLIRGALFVVLDVVVVLLLWAVAEGMAGRAALTDRVSRVLRLPSYQLRLTVALAVFFVVPTVGFSAWMGGRLRSDAARERDLVTRQALREATSVLADAGDVPPPARLQELLATIAARVGFDLVWYADGALVEASSPLLAGLGLVDPYLPPDVHRALALNDALEVTSDVPVAGRSTRVSYRAVGSGGGVLAAPRLTNEPAAAGDADLAFALLLVTVLGVGAAAGLARVAAHSLARPVGALSAAAAAVGRGEQAPPFTEDVPEEFASVSQAFTRMAADVQAARQRTVGVLRHVATGVIGLTRDLRVSVANPRAEELLRVTLPPDSAVRGLTGPDWATVWDWAEQFLSAGGDLDSREFTIGGRRVLAQVSRLGAEAGGCVLALDDITDLTHAVRVLAWGELARQVAHEIKNPLTPLRLGVQHLQRAYRGSKGEFDGILDHTSKQILGEIDRLDAVARAFARFGTPGSEPQAGPLEAVNVVEVARETAALYALGGATRVTVTADGAVTALSRRDELKEVLVNLVDNSRNADATGVELAVRRADGRVTLSVRDDGRGIPAETLPRIFEPHFSTTTSGTGLGLAICKRLVESWGGRLVVASEGGKGATVTVTMAPG